MGYNLKNARNGNSISKISSLRPLESTFICQFEFSENFRKCLWKMLLENKVLLSSNFFHTNLLSFSKIQTVIKSHSFTCGVYARGLKLGHFDSFGMLFWCFLKLQPIQSCNFMKSRSQNGLATKGLLNLNAICLQVFRAENNSCLVAGQDDRPSQF